MSSRHEQTHYLKEHTSDLLDGKRFPKDHPLFHGLGLLDELSSHLGYLRVECRRVLPGESAAQIDSCLRSEQEMLMKAMAVVARSEDESTGRLRIDLTPADVERIDARANDLRKQIHIEPRFYIPGDTTRSSAIADIARSRCRTAERAVVSLVRSFSQRRETLALVAHYLNELSDYLFVLARYLDSAGEDP